MIDDEVRNGRGEAGADGPVPSSAIRTRSWRARRYLLALSDCAAWAIALESAVVLHDEFAVDRAFTRDTVVAIVVAVVAQLGVGLALQTYRGRHRLGTLEEAFGLTESVVTVGTVLLVSDVVLPGASLPRSIPIVATALALFLALVARTVVRVRRDHGQRPGVHARRVIVFGAGNEGQQLIRSMLSDPEGGYLPVALLDDGAEAGLRRFLGVDLRGTRADLERTAATMRADLVVIATRTVDGPMTREIALAAVRLGLGVKVMPPLSEALRPWQQISELRDIDLAQLLGRSPVEIDLAAIAEYITGRRVLVTGAGGSIGSELSRQIDRLGPAELLLLDRDESALHGTQLSLRGTAPLDTDDVILADIRDAPALTRIFQSRRPDVVFHAAALKHLPLLQQYPEEAWKSNVVGTQNVLDAAALVGVEHLVNISTDKAADPTSVLGQSKRIGELLVSHAAQVQAARYLSVRFGNVLGSRGSVLSTFTEQIAAGLPITVTHPDVTRFFMTIPEAVGLILYAGAIGGAGQSLILDMGEPVRILDVARQLAHVGGKTSEIVFTGLREGEKLHEQLLGPGEVDHRPVHPAVAHVDNPQLDPRTAIVVAERRGASTALVELSDPASLDNEVTPRGGLHLAGLAPDRAAGSVQR